MSGKVANVRKGSYCQEKESLSGKGANVRNYESTYTITGRVPSITQTFHVCKKVHKTSKIYGGVEM